MEQKTEPGDTRPYDWKVERQKRAWSIYLALLANPSVNHGRSDTPDNIGLAEQAFFAANAFERVRREWGDKG